jgi:colicin import membrane protein
VVEPAPPKPQPIVEKDPELTPVQKPDIAVEKETPKKPVKPDPPKAKAEPKADPKKPDFSRELDKDLRKDPRSDMMAQLDKEKVGTTKGANDAALGVWKSKVAAKARARMRDFGDINPNLSAVITVTVLPNFEVLNAKVTRTSGDPAFDAAAERAVVAASPLPLPETPEAVGRSFTFTFRAR